MLEEPEWVPCNRCHLPAQRSLSVLEVLPAGSSVVLQVTGADAITPNFTHENALILH